MAVCVAVMVRDTEADAEGLLVDVLDLVDDVDPEAVDVERMVSERLGVLVCDADARFERVGVPETEIDEDTDFEGIEVRDTATEGESDGEGERDDDAEGVLLDDMERVTVGDED